ncbi:MAG: fused MFS/spermidine synthase [Dehalococcoidales bacterium]|nr:fused MFS/spermidine synthase [Dehalococcoidales bacterium]
MLTFITMKRVSLLWKANVIVFISSFCVMVIELVAARIMAPYIGVSLYTWTSIIGVILAGIASGNYLGGKIADRFPSPRVLAVIFFTGSLLTVAIPLLTRQVTSNIWFWGLPLMLNFTLRIACIFFLPSIVLSMVSPMVIKLTLADLGRTGGIVGTIYAVSTVGSIFGTFLTGFYLILLFGTRAIIWYIGGVLLLTGFTALLAWRIPERWRISAPNIATWFIALLAVLAFLLAFQFRGLWQENYTMESNYYTIKVTPDPWNKNARILNLDRTTHSYVVPDDPLHLEYDYIKIFAEIISYTARENPAPRVLHLGGGGYTLPRYLESTYPEGVNEVVEIDPAVTRVAREELGLPRDTNILTHNQDARLFLAQRTPEDKFDIVIGDVFSDYSTPYHLTTVEFDRMVKKHLRPDGVYLVNIIDSFRDGRYLPSFAYTLKHAFRHVYIFSRAESWNDGMVSNYVIAASDQPVDLDDYLTFIARDGRNAVSDHVYDEASLDYYLTQRNVILLTDDHAPTDILVAPLIR